MSEVFIATVHPKDTVLTAYTSLEKSKAACQRYAEEMGYAGKLKWKRKDGSWTCERDQLRFAIAPRILNGVSE